MEFDSTSHRIDTTRKHVITVRIFPSDKFFVAFQRRFHQENTYGGNTHVVFIVKK